MSVVITSFFTRNGQPATDIETQTPGFPLLRIWQINDGTPSGDSFVGEFQMVPVEDNSNDDGFYKYEFTTTDGFNDTNQYVFRVDGGDSLTISERYQTGNIEPTFDNNTVADAVWDEALTDHQISGSTGGALSQVKADSTAITQNLFLDANSVLDVVQLLLKHEAGRTRVDAQNATLTVYDEDCSTVLRTYQLLDSQGNPSTEEVCERKPIVKGTNDNTTITDTC